MYNIAGCNTCKVIPGVLLPSMATNLSAKLNIPEETAHRTKKHSTMTKGMVCMHNSGRLRGRDKLLSLALTWEPNLDRMSMPAKPAATILGSDISLSPSVIFSVTNPSREYKRRREKKTQNNFLVFVSRVAALTRSFWFDNTYTTIVFPNADFSSLLGEQ
jgi:hypothetical protein